MRTVRLATEADAAGILAVYAPYIRDTAVTFETETPSLDAFRCRMVEWSRLLGQLFKNL